jgi:hypothetical protein
MIYQTSGYVRLEASSNGSAGLSLVTTTGVTVNAWNHVAVVRYGNVWTIYINGTAAGTLTNSLSLLNYNGGPMIGGSSNVYPFTGYMDEIRISNVARYTANFTTFGQDGGTIASPTNFTSDANTKLLIHGEAGAASGKVTRIHGTSLAWK